jgi:tRNA pseudouridine38-40 synthase
MMVDAAMQCATGQMSLEALSEQLACREKHSTKLAPPSGLYLARILY